MLKSFVYAKNIGGHLRVLRYLENVSKKGAKLETAIAMRSNSSQNQEGGVIERREQSQGKVRGMINGMW